MKPSNVCFPHRNERDRRKKLISCSKQKHKRELSTEEAINLLRSVSWTEIAESARKNDEKIKEMMEEIRIQELRGLKSAKSFVIL